LGDEAVHDFVDRLLAGFGLRIPEVFGGCVAVKMLAEVVVNALAEGFFAEVVFNHVQNCAALAVGDAIEHLFDFVRRVGSGADGVRGGL
jgi:hypothetical protein